MDGKTRLMMYCTILILALAVNLTAVQGISMPPHRFYGTVTIAGQPAPDGTLIEAKIAGVTYATTATVDGKYGYAEPFYVPSDDLDTPEKDGGRPGDTVEFYVAGTYAASYTFEYGDVTRLNLEIGTPQPSVPTVTIIKPTTAAPTYTQSGKTIQITYTYTEANPKNATIKIFNATHTIATVNVATLNGGTNIQRTDNITIPAIATEGTYNLNVTIFNIHDLSATATQLSAVIIDNTAPVISDPYQDPPGQVVQPGETVDLEPGYDITVKVNITELNIEKVSLHYSVSATEWVEIQMTQTASGEYTATMPSSSFPPCTTIQYYIKAVDKAGNAAQTPTAGIYFASHVIPEYQKITLATLLPAIALIIALTRKAKKNP